MWGKKISLLLVVFLILPMSFALTINPVTYDIKDPKFNKEYNIVITVINPEVNSYDVTTHIDRESAYLKDYVTIEPSTLHLSPNGKKNIKITMNIPSNISPQKHELVVNFRALSHPVGKFRLTFEVEGKQRHKLLLNDVKVDATDTQTPVYFKLETENRGNVIAEAVPSVKLFKDGEKIDTLGEKSRMNIMPSKSMNLSLMYDPANLDEGGLYSFKAAIKYSNKTTQPVEKSFYLNEVKKDETTGKEVRTVKKNNIFKLPINIENPHESLSFYNIKATIPGTNVSKVTEGSLDKEKKEVILKLDTRKLTTGKYNLNVKVSKGKNLEDVEEKQYILKVESSSYSWIFLLIPIALLGSLGFIFSRKTINFAGLMKKLKPAFSSIRLRKLEKDISTIDKDFNKMEASISSLGQEVNNFINNANDWLDRYSRSNVRFR